jgi:hypothetical protein
MPRTSDYDELDEVEIRNILRTEYLLPKVSEKMCSMWWTFCQTGSFKSDEDESLDEHAALLLLLFVLDGLTHGEQHRQNFLIREIPNNVSNWRQGYDVSGALAKIRAGEYSDEDLRDEDAVLTLVPAFISRFQTFCEKLEGWSPLELLDDCSRERFEEALLSTSEDRKEERKDIFRFFRVLAWGCCILLPHSVGFAFVSALLGTAELQCTANVQ